MSETTETPAFGLREFKKQRTRRALIDAALDLFLAHGYEATTVDEIVAAVDVSQRTFFRYFTGKEEVALAFLTEYEEIFIAAVAARPAAEPPVVSLRAALNAWMAAVEGSDEEHAERFKKVTRLVDATPQLTFGQVRRFFETEQILSEIIARRMDDGPDRDVRARLVVTSFMAVVRVAFESCARDGMVAPTQVVPRIETLVAQAVELLPGEWSAGKAAPFR
jgi:AcrR family transcriptional regulator